MSIRTVESVLARVAELAKSDPSEDARAAYRVVLAMFARVDSCDMEAVQSLFVPPPACRCGLCDTDYNPSVDADWRDAQRTQEA